MSLWNLDSDRYGLKTIFHSLMGVIIHIISAVLISLPFDLLYMNMGIERSALNNIIEPILNIGIEIFLVRFYVTRVLKMPFDDFRIGKPRNTYIWTICAFILPLSVSAYFILSNFGAFTTSSLTSELIPSHILGAFFRICLVAGITEELIFRGLIMRLIERRWNKNIAIIAPAVLFGALHIFNMEQPSVIDVIQLLVAGSLVSIMFSLIAYQSGSMWASAIVHGVWNMIIIGGILTIDINPINAIFPYTLKTQSILLTGGSFGIEASLPAIIGYSIVIILAWFLHRRRAKRNQY